MFLETSALTGENVEEAFLKCARTILNKIESGVSHFFKQIYEPSQSSRALGYVTMETVVQSAVQVFRLIPRSPGPEVERHSLGVGVKMVLS